MVHLRDRIAEHAENAAWLCRCRNPGTACVALAQVHRRTDLERPTSALGEREHAEGEATREQRRGNAPEARELTAEALAREEGRSWDSTDRALREERERLPERERLRERERLQERLLERLAERPRERLLPERLLSERLRRRCCPMEAAASSSP